MNELVKMIKNEAFTDSLVIAQGTENQYKNVKELIQKYERDMKDFGTLSVLNGESTGGRPIEIILLNEEQATFLMTLLRNSKKVVTFKKELVQQFYQMRQYILEHNSPYWSATRLESKSNRRQETDEIKIFVAYAAEQGSKNAEKYYCNLSKLANKAVGIEADSRNGATINQLNNLILIEHIIGEVIKEEIKRNIYYKDIYKACKKRIEQFKEVAYLIAG